MHDVEDGVIAFFAVCDHSPLSVYNGGSSRRRAARQGSCPSKPDPV